MANEEQLSILKQGVDVWNKWRKENPGAKIDLSHANLNGVDLKGAYLYSANLEYAKLIETDFCEAILDETNLIGAHLRLSDLRNASLGEADLRGADLKKANLSSANLGVKDLYGSTFDNYGADLRGADLSEANLTKTLLYRANLKGANLRGCDFSRAEAEGTTFGNSDLSQVIGLENVVHNGPSSISTDAFALSKGSISDVFLRGCGLSDWEIEEVTLYNPSLSNEEVNKILYKIYDLRATQALQISPLFISYSQVNKEFVDKVGESLMIKGVRYWRDIHDMKSGRMEKQIDRAIRQNPTVLLVLSKHSLSSDWVEHEVRTARQLEKEMGRDALCPVALDDSWKSSRWPRRIMEQIMEYNILDFSEWEDDVKFEGMFRKLIDGLELFYKG